MKEKVAEKWYKGRFGGFSGLAIGLMIVVAGAFFALWPFAFIWGLNTLFGQGIPLNFWTWLAAVVVLLTVAALFGFGRSSSMTK